MVATDFDSVFQRYTSPPIPVSREKLIAATAKSLHKQLNKAAKASCTIYEDSRRRRCILMGRRKSYQPFPSSNSVTESIPLKLIEDNITDHQFDPAKWKKRRSSITPKNKSISSSPHTFNVCYLAKKSPHSRSNLPV